MDSRKEFTVRGLLVFSLVCFLLVTSVLASHFRGGVISWRAVDPDNFDGNVSGRAVRGGSLPTTAMHLSIAMR